MTDRIRHYVSAADDSVTVCGRKVRRPMYITTAAIAVLDDVMGCGLCRQWLEEKAETE